MAANLRARKGRGPLLGLALVAACTWSDAPREEEVDACAREGAFPDGPVRVDAEGRFVAGGTPFIPRGIGSYPLLQHAGNGRMDEVRDILQQAVALGRPLVRTNAFFDGGTNPARLRNDDGTLHEPGLVGLDRLLAEAEAHDVRLLLVLANNWSDYGGAPAVVRMAAPEEALPKDAFWSDPRAIAAQRDYLRALLSRTNTINGRSYADDPTIFAWELVNEARCGTEGLCGADTLVTWARTMATTVRDAGATQPIAWGGGGFRGRYGEDLDRIARDGAVDILTLHVYPFMRHALGLGGGRAGERVALGIQLGEVEIRDRAALARRHGRALLVEELGWRARGGAEEDSERAIVLGAWLRAARDEGVGALPWMIGERGRTDYDGLLIRPTDEATLGALRCE